MIQKKLKEIKRNVHYCTNVKNNPGFQWIQQIDYCKSSEFLLSLILLSKEMLMLFIDASLHGINLCFNFHLRSAQLVYKRVHSVMSVCAKQCETTIPYRLRYWPKVSVSVSAEPKIYFPKPKNFISNFTHFFLLIGGMQVL